MFARPQESFLEDDSYLLFDFWVADQSNSPVFNKIVEVGGELEFGYTHAEFFIKPRIKCGNLSLHFAWQNVKRWNFNAQVQRIFDSLWRHSMLDWP
jgi:hypothetical protein